MKIEKSDHKHFGLVRRDQSRTINVYTNDNLPHSQNLSFLSQAQQTCLGQKAKWEGGIRKSSGILVFSK